MDFKIMNRNKRIKRPVIILTALALSLIMTSCAPTDTVTSWIQEYNEKKIQENDLKYSQIVSEKAPLYGIDPEDVEVSQGGQYYRVLIDTIHSYDDMMDQLILQRKWLRFAYQELGKRYNVGFYDRTDPELRYGGFSDQDFGYDSEHYWNDQEVLAHYASEIYSLSRYEDKYSDMTPERFTRITGIDKDQAEEINHLYHLVHYASGTLPTPNKEDHTITFIPGDTISHREKFTIGDEACPIAPGKYSVYIHETHWGVIHVTDAEGNTKYRLDGCYKDGHSDELYEYAAQPAIMELNEGDVIYMTNCNSTFDIIAPTT